MSDTFSWVKGHGTRNDFLLLPDPDADVHGQIDPALVRALCDRRGGLGADGVLRVVRSGAYDDTDARASAADGAEWFMDYRNADGSVSEMCGNGIRVFARYLVHAGLARGDGLLHIGTRDGVKTARFRSDGSVSVDMGDVRVLGEVEVRVGGRGWRAWKLDVGNPHAVAMVGTLDDAGPLLDPPEHDPSDFPDGVNVEFVVRTGERAVAMRVHERGSGETQSCGTGAVAAAAAVARADGLQAPVALAVHVPGGDLEVTLRPDGGADLAGPAVLVAQGTWPLAAP
jgi:diaminopimelate epimerase